MMVFRLRDTKRQDPFPVPPQLLWRQFRNPLQAGPPHCRV